MTAANLLEALVRAGCRPTIDGPDLVFDADPPRELVVNLEVLLTGVRSLLLGKRWIGIDPTTGRPCGPYPARATGPLAYGALDPSTLLPRAVGLLIVGASAEQWDRLSPSAPEAFPDLFEPRP